MNEEHPIEFLLKQLLEYHEVPGYVNDKVTEYLDGYKCCAFCESCNRPDHDNCHGLDFDRTWCSYFRDAREKLTCFDIMDYYRGVLETSKSKKEQEE